MFSFFVCYCLTRKVYYNSIVKIRKSTKSHVSASLKDLEKKGLVERIQSADNKKHIEINLLNKAEPIVEEGAGSLSEKTYKSQMTDLMEAVFDAVYLIFDLIAGILFFALSNGNQLFILYGILTFTLCGGDAFHLVPRIFRAVRGSSEKIKYAFCRRITGAVMREICHFPFSEMRSLQSPV